MDNAGFSTSADVAPSIRLASVLLLAGAVTPSPLRRATGRLSFELPLLGGETLLDRWVAGVENLGEAGHAPELRLLLDADSDATGVTTHQCRILRDAGEIRGAAGALRDATADLGDDEWILAAPAAQVLLASLSDIVAVLAKTAIGVGGKGADVVMAASADGTPGFFMLARAGILRSIPPVGYIDLKEQALPALSKTGNVRGIRLAPPAAISVRTPTDYLRSLRLLSGAESEPWQAAFSLAEEYADVEEGATLHDSVALAGSYIASGAVLVRSLVCPGGKVGAGQVVVDAVVTATSTATNTAISDVSARKERLSA